MPAPPGNQYNAKPAITRVGAPQTVRGNPIERIAWNMAQIRSGGKWSSWARAALNAAVPAELWAEAGLKAQSRKEPEPKG
jgi:hypothetical protein